MNPTDYPDLDTGRIADLTEIDDGDLFRTLAERFGDSVTLIDAFEQAWREADPATARTHAHKLAGRALNLGARTLGDQARAIEHAIEDGQLAAAQASGPALRVTFERTLGQLHALLASRG